MGERHDRLHVGIVGPLPPAPTGPASYLARMLPALAKYADISCFVPDPMAVSGDLRRHWPIRHLDERLVAGCDVFAYHVANNPLHREVLAAALDGPPGLIVLHDASIHHLLTDELIAAGRFDDYTEWLGDAHGSRGRDLGRLRLYGGAEIEQFVFDALGPVLDRHRGVLVHSRYAAAVVERRSPGLPVFVVPHFAEPLRRQEGASSAAPSEEVVVAHFGFVTRPKRFVLLCEAVAMLRTEGLSVKLLFVGEDHSNGELGDIITALGLEDAVTVTGWVDDETFATYVGTVDVAVSLRWPQVGESSGTLAALIGAGRAVVVEAVGSWSELPDGVIARVRDATPESLADALRVLVSSPGERARIGTAARDYAGLHLSLDRCAALTVAAAGAVAGSTGAPPRQVVSARRRATEAFLGAGEGRLASALDGGGSIGTLLTRDHRRRYGRALTTLPVARPGADRLVDLGCLPALLRVFSEIWGYQAVGVARPDPLRPAQRKVTLERGGGLPEATVDVFACDLESDRLPFDTGSVDVVVCWEVLEHLGRDPVHLLVEINRILAPTGVLHLTTPNTASARSVIKVLAGEAAAEWPVFLEGGGRDRHNREYTPAELRRLLHLAGFAADVGTDLVWRDDVSHQRDLDELAGAGIDTADRGDNVIVVAHKAGLPLERYPAEFYA